MSFSDFLHHRLPFPDIPHLTHFHRGTTPLSTWKTVLPSIALYLAVIFGIREFMIPRKPFQLKSVCQVHNIVLSAGSLLLLLVITEEVVPIVWENGLFYAMCSSKGWTPKLELYYMINYYFKYVELLDTVFLALKKKPLTFLHVFHHSATAVLCFTQLIGRPTIAWIPISLNLTVHVFMYYYYYASAAGHKIWWKQYLTTMQITQFLIDVTAVSYAAYHDFANRYIPSFPNYGRCASSRPTAGFGGFILLTYLYLFIDFYKRTYKGKKEAVENLKSQVQKGQGREPVSQGSSTAIQLKPSRT